MRNYIFAKKREEQAGQSLAEIIIAVGVFAIGMATVGMLVLNAQSSSIRSIERTKAVFLAKEGLEAIRSIRNGDYDYITDGTYGIALSGGRWTLSGASDSQDKFTRTVSITSLDVDTKRIESNVSWQSQSGPPGNVVYSEQLADWEQTQGQGGELDVDISRADLAYSKDSLRKIKIRNIGSSAITIDRMAVWFNGGSLIRGIRIDGNDIFGPGGGAPSGTELNVNDVVLNSGSDWKTINFINFSGSAENTDFIIKFIMTDGSTRYVYLEAPPIAGDPFPTYTGSPTCPVGTTAVLIGSYSISSTDPDGITISIIANQFYRFNASGTFKYNSPVNNNADAGFSTNDNWITTMADYGIYGTDPNKGAHALLADLGLGVGIVDWGIYNSTHTYSMAFAPSTSSAQFLIGDRYGSWYSTPWQNQSGMSDNSRSLMLRVYRCN